jgi:hypothetical protein
MIEAMPAIVREHPDALYAIVGATHPNLVRKDGERHRQMLRELTHDLGVERHVQFIDRFVEQDELLDMLQAADVYVTPYLNMAQVTSGTLSYAVAVGKPVIATPYVHAREILADEHGLMVPPGDAKALARGALELLNDDAGRRAMAGAAYERGREMRWPRVVEQSLDGFPAHRPRLAVSHAPLPRQSALPLDAIERMSDGVGMLQHAIHSIGDRNHGYCIDDNARALMAMVRRSDERRSFGLASTYAAFVQHGWNPGRNRFRNFMGFDRRWCEDVGSEDSNGRTIWALGLTAARAPWPSLRRWALQLFEESAPIAAELAAPRARAFAALGGHELLQRHEGHELALQLMRQLGPQLLNLHSANAREGWNWFEPWLAYDNARLPEALIRAGQALGDRQMIDCGLATLDWLATQQSGPRGFFRPIGCRSFGRAYAPPLAFDQQPLEATATIDAAAAAHAVDGNERWSSMARDAFAWFFGANDAGQPLADPADGSCQDGLMATGINLNRGAESILSLHLAAQTMREVFSDFQRSGQERMAISETRTFGSAT